MEIVLLAAVAENGVIGHDNALPWRLKSDLKHFRALTIGKPVVMGRKTFESLNGPLKGRTNIVLSRDPQFAAPGILVARSLDHALEAAHGDALRRGVSELMIIGGSDLFSTLMPKATRLEITHVAASPEGDTFFPPIHPAIWKESARSQHGQTPDDSASFTCVTYRRTSGSAQ
jgi:dihydrofolate reductase